MVKRERAGPTRRRRLHDQQSWNGCDRLYYDKEPTLLQCAKAITSNSSFGYVRMKVESSLDYPELSLRFNDLASSTWTCSIEGLWVIFKYAVVSQPTAGLPRVFCTSVRYGVYSAPSSKCLQFISHTSSIPLAGNSTVEHRVLLLFPPFLV